MDYLLPQSITELGNCLMQLAATLIFVSIVQPIFLAGTLLLLLLAAASPAIHEAQCTALISVYCIHLIYSYTLSSAQSPAEHCCTEWHSTPASETQPAAAVRSAYSHFRTMVCFLSAACTVCRASCPSASQCVTVQQKLACCRHGSPHGCLLLPPEVLPPVLCGAAAM